MASINVSEEDFTAIADAAMTAADAGDMKQAQALDKIARKINAALTNAQCSAARKLMGALGKPMTWEQVPSVLYRWKV